MVIPGNKRSETMYRNKQNKANIISTKTYPPSSLSEKSLQLWGCHSCAWQGSLICPHGVKEGQTHSNGACKTRIAYIKEIMSALGSVPKVIQQQEIMKDMLIKDKLIREFADGGELHPDIPKYSKNILSGIRDMRRQNEGIKISEDINVTHTDFREMVDVEAKKIQERDKSARQAEFTEEVRNC